MGKKIQEKELMGEICREVKIREQIPTSGAVNDNVRGLSLLGPGGGDSLLSGLEKTISLRDCVGRPQRQRGKYQGQRGYTRETTPIHPSPKQNNKRRGFRRL